MYSENHRYNCINMKGIILLNTLKGSTIIPGKYNNYFIAGNITNAFVLGEIGNMNDFFLIGSEPVGESSYPLLSGNILDSEGKRLFTLERNEITINPGHCSKIIGNSTEYEIHDFKDTLILKVWNCFRYDK
jgi:hypothetical protein